MGSKNKSSVVNKRVTHWSLMAAMAGILLIATTVLLNGIIGQDNSTQNAIGTPVIEIDQNTFDYGDVKLGSVITTEVKVTNIGDEPLRFTARPYVELVEGC